MGIKERRDRERRLRAAAILATTRDIAAREGWQAVTIRRVADALELSAPTIYEHFASKDALLAELINSGYRQCLEVLRTARASSSDPVAAVIRMGEAYWDEAWSSPELYQVMYGIGGVAFASLPLPSESEQIHQEVLEAMRATIGPAADADASAEQRAQLFRAALHGLVTLVMAGRLAGGRASGAALVEPAIRAFIAAPPASVARPSRQRGHQGG